ncbi:MAG: helix-turn-helix transcriptional regulator [Planctomycetes bacterium]|nr:helix-turn-helix transcriptional regulator [Planctomycetota bacterium]
MTAPSPSGRVRRPTARPGAPTASTRRAVATAWWCCSSAGAAAPPPAGLERAWASPALADRWLEGECLWLASEAARDGAGRRQEADLRLSALVAHLLAGPVSAAAPLGRHVGRLVTAAQAWITAHAAQASVAAAAQALGTSPDHLNHLFRRERGYGPRTAIALARIDRAKLLLREGRLPLQAVAEAVGYATARHFCAVFRRLTGATPGSFRRAGKLRV